MDDYCSVMHDVMNWQYDTIDFDGEMHDEDDDEKEDDDDW